MSAVGSAGRGVSPEQDFIDDVRDAVQRGFPAVDETTTPSPVAYRRWEFDFGGMQTDGQRVIGTVTVEWDDE